MKPTIFITPFDAIHVAKRFLVNNITQYDEFKMIDSLQTVSHIRKKLLQL